MPVFATIGRSRVAFKPFLHLRYFVHIVDVYTGANVCCLHAEFFIFIIKPVKREDSTAFEILCPFIASSKLDGLMMACIAGDCNSSVCAWSILSLFFISAFAPATETF